VNLDDIRRAAALLDGVAYRTPIERFRDGIVYKAEHRQRTGSFKIRGAFVKVSAVNAPVVAASAGNHAQGVAWAAARAGVPATIVMPVTASIPKVEATRSYGAEVVLHGETFDDAMEHARSLDGVLIHPFDDEDVIAGQGTVGLEICEDAPDVNRVVVPVGGGGLASGIATAVKALRPRTVVVGVRAAATPATIADGAAVQTPMKRALSMLDDMVEVSEESVSQAIVAYLEEAKQLIEGAGALPLAAVLEGKLAASGTTLLVASGGNIDPGLLMRVIRHGLSTAGRYLFVRVRLRDRPGQLQRVLALLAQQLVNVVSIVHHRAGLVAGIEEVEVELTLETRGREHASEVLEALETAGYKPAL
jgi:threonine dehydratase